MKQKIDIKKYARPAIESFVTIFIGICVIYYLIIAPFDAQKWIAPDKLQIKIANGFINVSHLTERDEIDFVTLDNIAITLHCEPDPPIDQCVSDAIGYTAKPVFANIEYQLSNYDHYPGNNALLISMKVGNKYAISQLNTMTRINNTFISASRSGGSRIRQLKDESSHQMILFLLFSGLILVSLVQFATSVNKD